MLHGRDSQTVRLPDGRHLGFAEYGNPRGHPILYFHGFPGSRYEARLAQDTVVRLGARLIAPDRPGFGLSDHLPGRRLRDWPTDIAELAAHLGLRRFAVLGVSGGGPYAATCARFLGDRVTRAASVGGLGPPLRRLRRGMTLANRLALDTARHLPPLLAPLSRLAAHWLARHPHRLLDHVTRTCAECDRRALLDPRVHENMHDSFRECARSGWRGVATEWAIYGRPWEFEPAEIKSEFHIWHGECDRIVSPAMGRHLANTIPGCRAHFFEHEGHYSLPVNQMEAILQLLIE